jgi:OOP family OmpA-OmpF porin
MVKAHFKTSLYIVVSLLLLACAQQKKTVSFEPTDLNPKLQSGEYVQKVDNLLIIMDVSGSMAETYQGRVKLNDVKDIVRRLNQTIPDLKLKIGLRRFGLGTFAASTPTALIVDLSEKDKAQISDALKNITNASGESLLNLALDAGNNDLETTRGEIAVIVISDGNEINRSPVASAEAMKRKYGDRLCIYTVLIGNDPTGKRLMEGLSAAGGCGFSVMADDIMTSAGMAGFVEKVLLVEAGDADDDGVPDTLDQCPNTPRGATVDARGCPIDSDGDAVYDGLDRCPGTQKGVMVDSMGCPVDSDEDAIADHIDQCRGTPKGVEVDATGCPKDSDGDGVYDYLDRCAGTPKGGSVDAQGCPTDTDGDGIYDYLDKCPDTPRDATVDDRGCWVLKGVYFDTDKWKLKPSAYPILNKAVYVLNRNPDLKVEIQGHTDNVGDAQYNRELSRKRARAVLGYFIQEGISPSRLSYEGYGFSNPVASNATAEGRGKNRRVELKSVY